MSGGSLVVSDRLIGMDAALGIVASRAYRIVPGRRAVPLLETVDLSAQPVYLPSTNEEARPRLIRDAAVMELGKPLTDVVLFGHAYAPNGISASSVDTSVEVGPARKAVRALGQRRIEVTGSGLSLTSPEPFTKMPLTADLAYGGRDAHTERLRFTARRWGRPSKEPKLAPQFQLCYPRNGSGRGYFLDLDRDRIHGTLAPCLEDPTDPVRADRLLNQSHTDWIDRPIAASYEPIDIATFPRATFVIKPKHDPPQHGVHELSTGAVLHDDLANPVDLRRPKNPRLYNCGPSGLSVARLTGRERVKLQNLHAVHAALEFDLPDDEPKLMIDVPGVGERVVEARLGCIRIEPDADRVVLTWSGFLEVAAIYPAALLATMRSVATWRRSGESQ